MAQEAGFKWVRQGFPWNDIEISGKGDFTDRRSGTPVDAWAKYDRIVALCQKYGLQIIARLDSPPVWARMPGDDVETYRKGPPANNNDYGDFVAAVANRYKGKINYFQIWNEPNLIGEWGGHPISPAEYTALLKVAHDRIKAAIPGAVIISAALAPTTEESAANLNDVLYLEGMYQAGAAPYFDIMSTMLYGLGQSPEDRRVDLKRLSFSRPILLHNVMEKYGDASKPIWISEYAWISLPPDFKGDPSKNIWGKSVDEQTQARYLVEGYQRAGAEWPWMGVMFVWFLHQPDPIPNEPANYFSILNDDFTPRPAYNAIKDYSKRFPVADTGVYKYADPNIRISHEQDMRLVTRDAPPVGLYTDTLKFDGNRLDASLCPQCAIDLLSLDGGPLKKPSNDYVHSPPKHDKQMTTLVDHASDGSHTAIVRLYIGSPSFNDAASVTYTVSRDKPLWNALGFPLLYGLFGLFALASAGFGLAGLGRWAQAALDKPRARYTEEVGELARNGALVVGMALLLGLYYQTSSPPLMLLCLGGLGLLCMLKPSVGLAAVAFTIPFFWYPKEIGAQHFPLAETLLFLVLGAWMARRIVGYLSPKLAAQLHFDEAIVTSRADWSKAQRQSHS